MTASETKVWCACCSCCQIDSATALQIVDRDSTPMFVDPDFVRRTWKAMVKVTGREDALDNIVLKHPGSLVTQPTMLGMVLPPLII
eukprot:s2226_g1.t1